MASDELFKLADLAEIAGVTPRTVRYYIAQGLLPSPGRLGPGTRYGAEHLARLRLIKKLQDQHLPLADIRHRLDTLSDEELTELADSRVAVPAIPRNSTMAAARLPADDPKTAERSHWERIILSPDIELHVRRSRTSTINRRVDRLITFARKLIDSEK
jgi:DNA-binding transcriptional MerR regulator